MELAVSMANRYAVALIGEYLLCGRSLVVFEQETDFVTMVEQTR